MIYKVLIIKNNFKKKYNFKKGIEWFNKTPLDLEITEMETSIPLTFEKLGNATYKGYCVDDKVKEKLQTIIPRNSYHYVYNYQLICHCQLN